MVINYYAIYYTATSTTIYSVVPERASVSCGADNTNNHKIKIVNIC